MDYWIIFNKIKSIIFIITNIRNMQYLAAYTLASLSGKEPSNWIN